MGTFPMDARSPEDPKGLTGGELQAGLATEFVRPQAKENTETFVQHKNFYMATAEG